MSHFYLRLILFPFALFIAAILFIRSQPYDDHELRQILSPDGCNLPCFMGIQPGITTINEARAILKASGWAKNIVLSSGINQTASATFISVSWEWNSNRSPLLDGTSPAYVLSYSQDIHAVVNEIYVATMIPAGSVNLFLQSPNRYRFIPFIPLIRNANRPFYITLGYEKIEASTDLLCPLKMSAMWNLKTDLHFYSQTPINNQFSHAWNNRDIIQLLKSLCS